MLLSGLRYSSLGSGSEGNALVVQSIEAPGASRSCVLIDCGFATRELVKRLQGRGLSAHDIDAILITHEHGDHIRGAGRFAREFDIPVYCSYGTHLGSKDLTTTRDELKLHFVCSHTRFAINGLEITPYPVPHDAREPTQFTVTNGQQRLGVLTDAGQPTACITEQLNGCHGLVLECNHDRDMLRSSAYPESLKQRIGGGRGHLSNEQSARVLESIDRSRLKFVHAAHLSKKNNLPHLAADALSTVLGCRPNDVSMADQDGGFDWVTI